MGQGRDERHLLQRMKRGDDDGSARTACRRRRCCRRPLSFLFFPSFSLPLSRSLLMLEDTHIA